MDRARGTGALAAAVIIDLLLLAATGAWLTFRYRPDRPGLPDRSGTIVLPHSGGGWVADAHRWLAIAALVLVAALVVVTLARFVRGPRREAIAVAAILVAALAVGVAYDTGGRLPWSQLALSAVTVDSDLSGVWKAAFDPVVRFVITAKEVTRSDYQVWAVVHLFAAPAVGGAALGARVIGRRNMARSPSGG
ncbi:MAG TPA: hypothetical protein VF711_05065 [Acidimicrobiales bacterium]|jgi:quinol-cytochrome oxidoreductase complex cytochrome b subunit